MISRGARPQEKFYVLRNEIADDSGLSWAARGLLIHLLTKPDHWQVSVAALVNQTKGARIKSGRDAVYSLLRELENAGYVTRGQTRTAEGKLGEMDYTVSEIKVAPLTGQPYTVNPTLVITDEAKRTKALPERAHRQKRDELPMQKAKKLSAKAGNHPIWGHHLSKLTSEGVSERRARGCLAKIVGAVGEAEALDLLQSSREEGSTGSFVIDDIMRTYVASR